MHASDDADRIDELESLFITAEIIADGLKRSDLYKTLMCVRDSLREIRAIRMHAAATDDIQDCSPGAP